MSVNKNENWMRTTSIYVGSGLLLLISYFFLYVAMQMMTEIYLEPLHKSFTTRPNVFLPAAVIIGASALLFLVRMVREQDRLRLILIFALNHLFSLVLFTGLAIPMHHLLPRAWAPWPGLVSSATLLLALLLAQGTSWPWRRQPVRHLVWVALSLLLIVLVITFGGIVAAPSEQALTMGLPPSPSTVNPAAPSTPLPVPTAVAPEHPAQETHVRLGARPLHGEPPVAATLSARIYMGVDGACQSLRWRFDDGSESEQPCPADLSPWTLTARHTYSASGIYHPRLTLDLANGRAITSDTQTVVVAESQPIPRFRRFIYWGVWALSLLAAAGAVLWLRGRPPQMRTIGYVTLGLLLITFVPPFSYLPDPLGIVWAVAGGYVHDPRLPFADRFLVAGFPEDSLRPWLDGLIGQTGLDPLDPTAPLVRYEPVRVRVPRRRGAAVEVVIRFLYADGSRRTYALPLYHPNGFSGLYQSGWAYDGLARLRTEHRELPDTPFADDTSLALMEHSTLRFREPERLPLSQTAQWLDTSNPSNWYWYCSRHTARYRHMAWSPSDDAFLARAFADYHRDDLWLVSAKGDQAERLAEDVIDFDWSPGGRRVIFTRRIGARAMGIFALSLAEGGVRQLAQPAEVGRYDFPGVSEVGVWYISEGALWLAPFDGGPAQRIDLAHWGAKGPVRPAPDGSLVAYACSAGICLQDRSGGARRTIDAEAQQIAWSMDGSRLAAVAWEGHDDVVLTIARRDGQIERRVTIAPKGEASAPRWTPDGQWLFVQTSPFCGRRILTVNVTTGVVLDLSQPRWDAWFDLAPDGERLLLTNGRGGFWTAAIVFD